MGTSRMNEMRRDFDSRDVMADQLADAVSKKLTEAVEERGRASLSVGGGRFPKPFFRKLAQRQVPWAKVTVVLGDERWVSPDDEASNEKLVRENLLQGPAAAAKFVGLKTAHNEAELGLSEIESRLRELPPFIDVIVVGMGEDGHTASLFPSASESELAQALNPANAEQAALMHPTVSDVPRITLTLPRLKASRWLVVAAPGAGKLKTFEAAMQGDDILSMPVRALLQQVEVPVEFWWAP